MTRSTRLYHQSSITERNETDSDPIIVSVANQVIPEYLKMQNPLNLEDNTEEPKKRPLFSMNLRETKNISKQTFNDSSINQNAQLLPTCFNLKTKSQWAELEPGNLQVSYSGLGKGAEIDPGTVKGNYAIPPSCGIYYYEVKILSKGRDGYIGVGFTTSTATQQRLPGVDEKSWGYHASDGKKYNSSNTGIVYGPTFSTGDLIGCCINFSDLSISFTRNGIMLGTAWKGLHILEEVPIYPVVGLRTPGEVIVANFGLEPFRFDISQYYRDEKLRLLRHIFSSVLSAKSVPTTAIMNSLLVEYLVRQGYHETALTLYESSIKQLDKLDETGNSFFDYPGAIGIEKRKQIFSLITSGKIPLAMKMINQLYPSFAIKFPLIISQLECLHFVEIIRSVSLHTSGDVEMISADSDNGIEDIESPSILDAIKLSQELKNNSISAPKILADAIDEIICLICYQNPFISPLAYILDPKIRSHVGEIVNAGILELENCNPESSLERLYRQIMTVDELMIEKRSGSRTLLSLQKFIYE